ncbi:hypothetical protein EMCRGX_G023237 [Ephydatia muelleri]
MAGSCVSAWPGKYISLINLLKASLVYAADSAEVTYTNKSITRGHTKAAYSTIPWELRSGATYKELYHE